MYTILQYSTGVRNRLVPTSRAGSRSSARLCQGPSGVNEYNLYTRVYTVVNNKHPCLVEIPAQLAEQQRRPREVEHVGLIQRIPDSFPALKQNV